ncbi:hypothetical protein MNV49_006407 [Pseudohyphozyma bogoriensis]|nr:hypothetical protein MNV49_006407 [Pseudohyphozyma bogoriensis]
MSTPFVTVERSPFALIDSAGSLVYGLPLNAYDLVKAGRTYHKFIPNALVLDLIIARKERGVVVRYEKRWKERIGLADLPLELLEMVRWELLQSFMQEEESYFSFVHRDLMNIFEELELEKDGYPERCDCGGCFDVFHCAGCRWTEEHKRKFSSRRDAWRDPWTWAKWEWQVHDEYDCVTLPAFTRTESSIFLASTLSTALSAHTLHYHSETLHTASFFSPNFFDITPADDLKFERLVRDFSIRVMDVPAETITRDTADERAEQEEQAEEEESKLREWEGKVREKRRIEKAGEPGEQKSDGATADVDEKEDDELIPAPPPLVRPSWMLLHTTPVTW